MIVFKIILWLFLILLSLIFLIIIIPFSYNLRCAYKDAQTSGDIAIKWAFGLIGIRYWWEEEKNYQLIIFGRGLKQKSINNKNKDREEKNKEKEKSKPKKIKKEREKITHKEVKVKELIHILKLFLRKLIEILKPKYFRLYIRYGFDEPAIMGMMAGIIAIFTEQIHNANIYINTTFEEEVFEGEVELNGNLIVSRIIILILTTIFKKPVRVLIFRKKKKISNLEEVA